MPLIAQLDKTASIYRASTTGTFELVKTWSLLASVPCMLDMNSWNRQYIDGSGKTEIIDAIMYCDSTDISSLDRVIIDSIKYEAITPDNPCGMSHHLEVLLKRLPAGTEMTIPAV